MRIIRLAFIALATTALAAAVAFAACWLLIDWTDVDSDEYPGGIVLRDSAGRVMRVSLGENDVDCRPDYRADPDDWIVKALVASEDGTFWTHRGVRPLSVLRAAFQNLTTGRRISGASTISMQTVRLIAPHPKSLMEKLFEAVRAVKMERRKDKLWILSQYLNRAPFGSNFVGIEAAASGWFGKGAKSLGIGEAACLAGMVQAPSRFRPDRHLDRALKRRDYVLGRMRALGFIDDDQLRAAQAVRPVVCRAPRPFDFPHYCDWATAALGMDGGGRRRGGDVVTALDADVQRLCERTVDGAAASGGYSSAAVVVRVADGAVLALACSGGYFGGDGSQVNTALAPRPAGSTLKPFLAALAFDRGLATPEERLADVPLAFGGYRPANFDNRHRGLVTVRDALVMSLNVPFVSLLQRVGVPEFATALRSLGFAHLDAGDETYGLGLAIGNAEVSLMELTAACAALARGGVWLPPSPVAGASPDAASRRGVRVFTEGASYLVSDALSGDERSLAAFGHVADVETSRFAWKTGTSSAYRDAWTVAWNPEFAVGVWCGHKSGGFGDRALVGAKASAPLCRKIARALYPGDDGPWFAESKEVVRRTVCARTGLPAGEGCAATEAGRALAGRSPSIPCRGCRAGGEGRRLAISKPQDKATFRLVEGRTRQRIICRVAGAAEGERLWWFADGVLKGESAGLEPCVLEMDAGRHLISCVTADGESASAEISVSRGPFPVP